MKLGDKIYQGSYERVEQWTICPDCLGSKQVKVTLADGTEIMIECGGCDPGGFEPSTGRIRQYQFTTVVKPKTITGIKTTVNGIEYELDNFSGSSYSLGDPSNCFATKEEAFAFAEGEREKYEAEENKRWLSKTKSERTWKWNYSYHLRCAKKAQQELEYHERKAKLCKSKMKQEVPNENAADTSTPR